MKQKERERKISVHSIKTNRTKWLEFFFLIIILIIVIFLFTKKKTNIKKVIQEEITQHPNFTACKLFKKSKNNNSIMVK